MTGSLMLATGNGVFLAEDNGVGYEPRPLGLEGRGIVRWIVADPSDPGRAWAATERAGVWRTDDGGKSWAEKNEGLVYKHCLSLALHPATGDPLCRDRTRLHLQIDRRGRELGRARNPAPARNAQGLDLSRPALCGPRPGHRAVGVRSGRRLRRGRGGLAGALVGRRRELGQHQGGHRVRLPHRHRPSGWRNRGVCVGSRPLPEHGRRRDLRAIGCRDRAPLPDKRRGSSRPAQRAVHGGRGGAAAGLAAAGRGRGRVLPQRRTAERAGPG